MRPTKNTSFFTLCSRATARATGQPGAFLTALAVVLTWAATGPIFHYSNTWQLVINTGTTIITFLMVFLIQATQNRDSEAVHLKLDELIRAMHGAHNALLDLEELEQKDLDKIRETYVALAKSARDEVKDGRVQTGRKDQKG
jgi:low affinity Fe/Cu permease